MIANALPTVRLSGPVAVNKPAINFGVSFSGVYYPFRFDRDTLPNGRYIVTIEDGKVPNFVGWFDLTDANGGQAPIQEGPPPATNQAPTVQNQIPDQTGKVGISLSYQIPNNTFADSDGQIVQIGVNGIPLGLSWNEPVRVISGIPQMPGTFVVIVTAMDDKGATVEDRFNFVIAPDQTNPENPPPTSGYQNTFVDVPPDPDILDLRYSWSNINGELLAHITNAAPTPTPQPGERNMWWISGYDEPFYDNFPNDLYVPEDTWLNVYFGQGPRKEVYNQGYINKSNQTMYIGKANT
ncbi:hypothetical protein DYU11_18535 [Fibrisoma montanum]|uniref:Dystroglycan-type cadherin-like domain-containing protein n=1 Tax=Fibrisoma montanum TaxID=2305895 RepID=A0A418M6B0_9BACT|nr:hypothetical protein DYU11_18535 [Fibrisoma montanum]